MIFTTTSKTKNSFSDSILRPEIKVCTEKERKRPGSRIVLNATIFGALDGNFEIFLPWNPWLPRCSKNLARSCHGIQDASKRVNPGDDEISGIANTTKFPKTKFLPTKFLSTKFLATKIPSP